MTCLSFRRVNHIHNKVFSAKVRFFFQNQCLYIGTKSQEKFKKNWKVSRKKLHIYTFTLSHVGKKFTDLHIRKKIYTFIHLHVGKTFTHLHVYTFTNFFTHNVDTLFYYFFCFTHLHISLGSCDYVDIRNWKIGQWMIFWAYCRQYICFFVRVNNY